MSSTNLDLIRAKLEKLQNKMGSEDKKDNFFKPTADEKTIRILPVPDGDPFKEYFFHYNVGPGFLCPKRNFALDCPICKFVATLFKEAGELKRNNQDHTSVLKMAKDLVAKARYFSPVVVRGLESEGVKVWGYGKTAYADLLSYMLNPEYGDITDTTEGTDITVSMLPAPKGGYPKPKLTPKRKPTALSTNKSEAKEMLNSIPDFSTLFETRTANEVQQLLEEFLNAEADPESVSSETEKYGNNTEMDEIDQAFSELNQ